MKLRLVTILLFILFLSSCSKEGYYINDDNSAYGGNGIATTTDESGLGEILGVMNAGEWNDGEEWEFWESLSSSHNLDSFSQIWGMFPYHKINVRLLNGSMPIPNKLIRFKVDGHVEFSATTDKKGEAVLWYSLDKSTDSIPTSVSRLSIDGFEFSDNINYNPYEWNEIQIDGASSVRGGVEVAFVVDATGSMGEELDFLKRNLEEAINSASSAIQLPIKTKAILYRDENDRYLVRSSGWADDVKRTSDFLKIQQASGGGDFPEAVHVGLSEAISGTIWSEDADARIVFLMLDAPPHKDPLILERLYNTIGLATQKGIKVIPIASRNINRETEMLMRFIALATHGTYVFITSGTESELNKNKSTVGTYQVEELKNLITRLIIERGR